MNPTLKNVLAVVAGIVIGSIVNLALVSSGIIPYPEGITMENIAQRIPELETKHFIMPFLGHAIGTLVGAFVAAKIAATHKMQIAMAIGAWFLLGGAMNIFMMKGTPIWFMIVDMVGAYIPMGWLGGTLASGSNKA